MTTFTTQKSHILRFAIVAIAFLNLLQPVKIFAQDDKVQTYQIYPLPAEEPSMVSETDLNSGLDDISGKLPGTNQPNPNSVLPPPPNDNCATALNAANTLTPGSNYKCGTLANATLEAGEFTGCFAPAPSGTVWFSFIATQAKIWINVKPNQAICTGVASSFGIAVYQSSTCFPTVPVACLNYFSATASNVFSKLNLTGLSIGSTYMVQLAISSVGCTGNTWKPFCIKIGVPSTCNTCATNCGPMCVWAGNPPTVTDITTTCPSYGWAPPMNMGDSQTNCFSFTAANDTVWLQQIVYSYCNPGNTLSFTYNLYNAGCGLIGSGNVFTNNMVQPLVVGTTYKICYTLTAACSWDSVFWPYAYTTSTTLPVELISFGAMPVKEKVKIYWTTASEENAKEFIIEKTRNGMDFTEVGRVKAAGNSTSMLNYRGYDDNPSEGNNYYRLKQVDFNGKYSYTKLVSAKYLPSAADLGVQPNPAKDNAVITFNASGNYPVRLKVNSMQGKMILDKYFTAVEGVNEYSLNMSELPKGIYSVQLIVDDENMISKLVKE
jgi:hypothetical protein